MSDPTIPFELTHEGAALIREALNVVHEDRGDDMDAPPWYTPISALDRLEAELKGYREALVDIAKHSYPGEYPMDNAAKLNRIAYRARAALADQQVEEPSEP